MRGGIRRREEKRGGTRGRGWARSQLMGKQTKGGGEGGVCGRVGERVSVLCMNQRREEEGERRSEEERARIGSITTDGGTMEERSKKRGGGVRVCV